MNCESDSNIYREVKEYADLHTLYAFGDDALPVELETVQYFYWRECYDDYVKHNLGE